MHCHKHTSYTGQRRPNRDCLYCWLVWLRANPDATVRTKDVERILQQVVTLLAIHDVWINMGPP